MKNLNKIPPRQNLLSNWISVIILICLINAPLQAQQNDNWVEVSNQNSMLLLDVIAKHYPEYAGSLGLDGYDEEIQDLTSGFRERHLNDFEKAKDQILTLLENTEDGPINQDLQIMLTEVSITIEGIHLYEKYLLPYWDVSTLMYFGIRSLLEDRIPEDRQKAALVRLRKYVGSEKGFEPLSDLMLQIMKDEWSDPKRMPPFKEEVERNLNTSDKYIIEIGELFEKYKIKGYKKDYEKLIEQVRNLNAYVRKEILPKSRTDFKLPPEVYAFGLKERGVDMPVDELQRRAKVAFKELQAQMQVLSNKIAEEQQFESNDYRDVIRSLKKIQLDSASILPLYRRHMKEIEAIIKREEIVSLPERGMKMRLATKAESASSPAPFFSRPRLIGNTGEFGEFVLPLKLSGGSDGSPLLIDDFTNKAASWMLASHEARPGHELQFSSIIELGVSQARMIFAMNSVNIEGWGLYMEEQMLPYLPIEGQLMILWSRALRASRAFLDPGLNLGYIETAEARRFLQDENIVSEGLIRGELERYRYLAPGQATSYFNGYLRLMELRVETELLLGEKFNQLEFHDFILSQGMLPLKLTREAVLNEFIPLVRDRDSR